MKQKLKISVIIPTYNAGKLLFKVLPAVEHQSILPYEIIIIDSNSTDDTLNIANSFPVKCISIAKKDFNHGGTRNYGARLARGDYIVYLTQDVVPMDNEWLENLIKPIHDNSAVGAFSRQIAQKNAVPTEKFFYSHMYPSKSRMLTSNDLSTQEILFSNASSAVKKSYILDNPFSENILMSEDYEWALRMLGEWQSIAYVASSKVLHSHDVSFIKLFKRYFDFGVSHNEISSKQNKVSFIKKGIFSTLEEILYHAKHGNFIWAFRSFTYNFSKFLGLTLGGKHKNLPRSVKLHFTSYYKDYWK